MMPRFSLLALAMWMSVLSSPSALAGARHALLIASPDGDADEKRLQWADADVERMRDVLVELGGFSPADVVVISRGSADDVRKAAISVNERVRGADGETVFLFYYSGHADAGALHLAGTHLDMEDVRGLVRGSAADFRLLIVDACRSGAITQVKGVQRTAQSFDVDVDAVRDDSGTRREGVVMLTSAAAGEDAQESDLLRGSFFTHALVSGLVGAADANDDGAVVLEEAYRYAYNATLRSSSRTVAGPQHPTFQYDFRGRGDLVLTRLDARSDQRGQLSVPSHMSFLVMRDGPDGDVVAEVQTSTSARSLSVRPGRYWVRGRAKDALYEGAVDVTAQHVSTISISLLERTTYARLVRKGGSERQSAASTFGGYFSRTGFLGHSQCHGMIGGATLDLPLVTLSPRMTICESSFSNSVLFAHVREASASFRVASAVDLAWSTFDVGILAGGSLLSQTFVTNGDAPHRLSSTAFFGVGAGALLELPAAFYGFAEADGRTYMMSVLNRDGATSFDGQLALGIAVGIGKRF